MLQGQGKPAKALGGLLSVRPLRRRGVRSVCARLLVYDGLIDKLPDKIPVVVAQNARRLRHEHGGDLLLRVDLEVGARVPAPVVISRRAWHPSDAIRRAHGEAKPERVVGRAQHCFAGCCRWLET